MNNLRWLIHEELIKNLTPVDKNTTIEKSGIPMTYDENKLYIDNSEAHSLVIGTTGSGKTQSTLLPQARLSIRAGETIIVNDVKGEIKESLSEDLNKYGYDTIVINLADPTNSNFYNPLKMPYDLYKNGNKDQAMELLENIAYYLLSEKKSPNSDPFWENSAINYFTGLALYLFDKSNEEVTINSILNLSTEISSSKERLEMIKADIEKNPSVNMNLTGILQAPVETRGSIISVFSQKIKLYVSRENLSNMMSKTDFDMIKAINGKTAIFIISGTAQYASSLIPLIINELYYCVDMFGNKEKRVNILLDEFGRLKAMKDIITIINNSRSINVKLTLFIMSFLELKNTYGDEVTELIKISCGNIIYLLASDIETLDEISKMCGYEKTGNRLITPEELKLLDKFEAIILVPRLLPIKTKLIADYLIEWN